MSYCSPSNILFSQLQQFIINHMWNCLFDPDMSIILQPHLNTQQQ